MDKVFSFIAARKKEWEAATNVNKGIFVAIVAVVLYLVVT